MGNYSINGEALSSAEASYSRTLTASLGKNARRLGRGKSKIARGTLGREEREGRLPLFPSSHRFPRSRFLHCCLLIGASEEEREREGNTPNRFMLKLDLNACVISHCAGIIRPFKFPAPENSEE